MITHAENISIAHVSDPYRRFHFGVLRRQRRTEDSGRCTPCMPFALEFVRGKYLVKPVGVAIKAVVGELALYPQRNGSCGHETDGQTDDVDGRESFVAF